MPKILLISILSIILSACTLSSNQNTNLYLTINPSPSMTPQPTAKPQSSAQSIVSLTTKNGDIVIKLYSDKTPKTAATFLSKVNSGFYNGLIFHRVIPGFMAQGGDPTGTGTGGGSQPSELNTIPFVRGSLGLARTPVSKDISNDSQFFICFTTEGCQHLTGDYVNFGEVISGLDILDKIVQGDKIIKISTTTK